MGGRRGRAGIAKPSSPIDVVEAAYHVGQARDAWLRGVLDAAAPLMAPCIGAMAYFMDFSGSSAPEGLTMAGTPWFSCEDVEQHMLRTPPRVTRDGHLDLPRVANTISEVVARGEMLRADYDEYFRRLEEMRQRVSAGRGAPIRDFLGVLAFDVEGRGVVVTGIYDHAVALDRASRRQWTLVAAHIATAARLRRVFEAAQGPLPPVEAILTPAGRVEHAEGDAKERWALESLHARAVTIDRARSRRGRSDPDAALEAWQALVSGRWSLVDRFESDGRRYVVAHRNEPKTARLLSLTSRERRVVSHLLLGHTSKLTAYTLGVSPAAVSAALKSSLQKLGVRSAAQLLHRLSGMTGGGVSPGKDGG